MKVKVVEVRVNRQFKKIFKIKILKTYLTKFKTKFFFYRQTLLGHLKLGK